MYSPWHPAWAFADRLPHSPETCLPVRRVSRLAEPGRACSGRVDVGWTRCRIFVRLSLAQHPVTCLGKMSGHGDDGSAMSLAGGETSIEPLDVRSSISLEPHCAGGSLDQSPLEAMVHIAACSSMPDTPAAGDDPRHKTCVPGQVLGSRESLDVADLRPVAVPAAIFPARCETHARATRPAPRSACFTHV